MKKLFLIMVAVAMTAVFSLNAQVVIPAERLEEHVLILASDSLAGRGFGFPEKQKAVDYITEQYSIAGFSPLSEGYIHSFIHHDGLYLVEGKNIIGVIEGSDPQLNDEYILIGAHYDHMGWKERNGEKVVFNGADDNASGVASIIEIGKELKKAGLKRSVLIVAFDGEEAGLLGSTAFVSDAVIDPSKIKVMFSFDMVGMLTENQGVNLDGINSLKNGKELAEKIAAREMIEINKASNTIERQTDTWSFGLNNIPAVHVFTGLKSPYHKPEDDADKLDYEGMSLIADYMTALVSDIAAMEDITADQRFIRHAADPRLMVGFRFNIGSSKLYCEDTFYSNKPVIALEAGLVSKMKMSHVISLQPGFSYMLGGSSTPEGKMRTHSMSPALDILFTTPEDDMSATSTYFSIGGFYRYTFAGSVKESDIDFADHYITNEKGLRFGFGVQVNKVQAGYVFEYGLDKANRVAGDGNFYNRSNRFSVIMFF